MNRKLSHSSHFYGYSKASHLTTQGTRQLTGTSPLAPHSHSELVIFAENQKVYTYITMNSETNREIHKVQIPPGLCKLFFVSAIIH